ncbi:MAG: hemolysin III family protein [Clostridiales bacterium]|nr:hemolysin III family protein [Clostridiales bacterium]
MSAAPAADKRRFKDPVSSFTHLSFAVLSLPVTALLVYLSVVTGDAWRVVSVSIFGLTLLLLYSASAVYHMLPLTDRATTILKKIDHMMIFLLIAGTYTPICLVTLRGAWGWSLFGVVWGMAVAGIVLKALWIDAPRWLSTVIYVAMGWSVIIAFYPLARAMPLGGVALLLAGGLTYTAGALIYALKRPRLNFRLFGFHEIFHLFVMGGTVFHVLFMFFYVIPE